MVIQHVKKSKIAMAPEAISDCINRYTDHESFVTHTYQPYASDIVHWHNKRDQDSQHVGREIMQYHSEPFRVDLDVPCPKLVLCQYHALLPEYGDCRIVRNPIDLGIRKLPDFSSGKIRIGYSPSVTRRVNQYYDKGFDKTKSILESLPADLYEWDIITGVPLNECIERKSRCHIVIDECVTGSFHRSGLEGLALGAITIAYVKSDLVALIQRLYGLTLPFVNVKIDGLRAAIAAVSPRDVLKCTNAEWMRENWSPATIAGEYIDIYEEILKHAN